MIRRLLNLAKIYNIAIIGSNQVVTNPQAQFTYDPIQQKVPTGGTVLGHNANTRLYLRKAKGSKRIVRLFDSNWRPEGEATVKIGPAGIEDVSKEEEGE
jgi:RecA/RadA recombinase